MSSVSHASHVARKHRQCDSCLRTINPGDIYLRSRVFTGGGRGLPRVVSECESCARKHGRGELLREQPVKQYPPCTECGGKTGAFNNSNGLCRKCYHAARRRAAGIPAKLEVPNFCQYDDCDAQHFAKGRCRRHYQRDRLRAIRDGVQMTATVTGPSGPTRAVRRKAPEHEQHLEGRVGGMNLQDRPLATSPEPIGHWDVRPGITIVHWPTKETGAFPYTCPDCNEKILEAS